MAERFRKRSERGVCLHPEASTSACNGAVTAAHTIQRRGGLRAIADNTNHVLTVIPTLAALIESSGVAEPRRVGINDASTFPGFCNFHDQTFSPIEGEQLVLGSEAAFLFAYRSICLETFRKGHELANAIDFEQEIISNSGKYPPSANLYAAAYLKGNRMGLQDAQRHKAQYDKILLENKYHELSWLIVEFNGLLPIVTSASFFPEFDFGARPLQKLGEAGVVDSISMNITSYNGRAILVFSWLRSSGSAPSAFAESFVSDVPNLQKANAAICTAFEASENTFINPSWWAERTDFQRHQLRMRSGSGTPSAERESNCFQNYGRAYSTVEIISVQRSS